MDNFERRELARQLDNIEALAREKGFCNDLLLALKAVFSGYITTPNHISLKSAFRARKLDNGAVINSVSQLWHPPSHQLHRFGRANMPFSPLLYCSDGELMAIREVGGQTGDQIAILEMQLRNPEDRPFVFVIGDLVHRLHRKQALVGGQPDRMIGAIKGMSLNLDRAAMIDGFFSKAFGTKGDKLYSLTAALTQNLISSGQVDGIVYPTVAGPVGFNLALTPSSASNLFAIKSVFIVRLKSVVRDTFVAVREKVSRTTSVTGDIAWQ